MDEYMAVMRWRSENWSYFRWLTDEEHQRMNEEQKAIFDRNECQHPKTAVRYATTKSGQTRYYVQCVQCGRVRPIAKSELTSPDNATPVDEQARAGACNYRLKRSTADIKAMYEKWLKVAISRDNKRQVEYSIYLHSPEWKAKRTKVLERAGGICEGCGDAPAVEVHHLTYERIYNEMLFDLVAVCRGCHDQLHPWKEGK